MFIYSLWLNLKLQTYFLLFGNIPCEYGKTVSMYDNILCLLLSGDLIQCRFFSHYIFPFLQEKIVHGVVDFFE